MEVNALEKSLFENAMEGLLDWCGKTLSDKQATLFYQKLKHIPDSIFEKIIEKRIAAIRPGSVLPSPNDINGDWLEYKQSNPEVMVRETQPHECHECNGTGIIEYYRPPHWMAKLYDDLKGTEHERPSPVDYQYITKCGRCENWKIAEIAQGAPMLTKAAIESVGWKLIKPERKPGETVKHMGALSKMALRDMPTQEEELANKAKLINDYFGSKELEPTDDQIPF